MIARQMRRIVNKILKYGHKRNISYLGTGIILFFLVAVTFLISQRQIQYSHSASMSSVTIPGLITGYALSEGSGTVASDSSGNNNTATISGAIWTAGKYGNGLVFNGINSFLTINNSSSLDSSGSALTLSLWLNPQSIRGDSVVLGKFWNSDMTSPFYQYGLELQGGGKTPVFQIGTPQGVKSVSMGSALTMKKWSYLAVVFNGTYVTFYVNGKLISKRPLVATITARGTPVRIGADANGSQFYKGILDEVRIYSKVLSDAEILSDMNNSITESVVSPTIIPSITQTPTSQPTQSPTPTQTQTSSDFPNDSNTGIPSGIALTVITGDMTITTPNTVISGKDILGCVDVHAPGVVIRNSKIACSSGYAVYSHTDYSGTPLLIEDSEIHCNNTNATAIGDTNIIVRRANIHGCENGFDMDGDISVVDSYVHDLTQSGTDPHTDGIQITDVGHNITISHNTIYAFTRYSDGRVVNGTSAIISPSTNISNILIEKNLMAGGAYTLYCRQNGKGNNYQVIGNHFSTIYSSKVGEYGLSTDCSDEIQSGNVYHETGQPLTLE